MSIQYALKFAYIYFTQQCKRSLAIFMLTLSWHKVAMKTQW
mgnify:CR=1 FL=1